MDGRRGRKRAWGPAAQRAFLDKYASSQAQVRQISSDLIERLSSIDNDGAANQLKAALTLVQMKVAPVITVHIPFGGDNHDDVADDGEVFANERKQHTEFLPVLGQFFSDLESHHGLDGQDLRRRAGCRSRRPRRSHRQRHGRRERAGLA